MTNPVTIITIDGPSGAGKGTISRLVAEKLGFHLLDSGALYRLLALKVLQQSIEPEVSEQQVVLFASTLAIDFLPSGAILLDGKEVTSEIRKEVCSMMASKVAAMPPVRQALLQRQKDFAKAPGLVADGRDMGTTVFPNAEHKFFLTASAQARAERRFAQLQGQGVDVSLAALIVDIQERDNRDQNRAISPLKPASDARLIDSTSLGIEEVLALVLQDVQPMVGS